MESGLGLQQKYILKFWDDALIALSVDKSFQKNMSLINSLYFDQESKNLTKLNSKCGNAIDENSEAAKNSPEICLSKCV